MAPRRILDQPIYRSSFAYLATARILRNYMPRITEGNHPIYAEFAEALDLVEAKAHDYAEDDNVFSNFEFAAQVAGVEPEQVFAVLLGVKVARLGQLIGNGKEPNFESIGDTLLDTMNYAGLLKAYLRQEADNMTILDAYDAAAIEAGEDIDWTDAIQDAQNKDWPVGLGDLIKRKGMREGGVTYKIVDIDRPNNTVYAVPDVDWQDRLGSFARAFPVEAVELA